MVTKSAIREIAYALIDLEFERSERAAVDGIYDSEILDLMVRASDMLISIIVYGLEADEDD